MRLQALRALPPVIKPMIGVVLMLLLIWLPAVQGMAALFSSTAETIPERYQHWWQCTRDILRRMRRDWSEWRESRRTDGGRHPDDSYTGEKQ